MHKKSDNKNSCINHYSDFKRKFGTNSDLCLNKIFHRMAWRFTLYACYSLLLKDCLAADLWDVEVSLETEQSVPFLNSHITVFKHKADNRYFMAPLAILLEHSAESNYNDLTAKFEMSFDIEMFSDEARTVVVESLRHKHPLIEHRDVELLPTEKLRLVWNNQFEGLNPNLTLGTNWISNTGLQKRIRFKFSCGNQGTQCPLP